ncbi:MlaA family lipoprotein [Methylocucumis oryzae]|uniref:MlaA family lipoprotein n=1 Tax=Methylocucumis oryzae TaxID=1632867 RepID=UPI000B1A4AD8|nr:VacJ family lipoprotein [Methylocucumis oryzae]
MIFCKQKFSQGGMDASRLVVNSTLGVAGFVDVAQHMSLPKHQEDFGQTLGYWGVPSGPYLVLPFFGPSSPRDAVGIVGDAFLHPLTYVSMFGGTAANAASAGATAIDIVDRRADLTTTEKIFNEATSDSERYEFLKNTYQQKRESLVHDGKITDDLDDDYDSVEPTSSTSNPGSANAPTTSDPAKRHLLELTAPADK